METLVNSIIEYLKQVAQPILFLAFVFCITVAIRLIQEEWRNKYFDENEFGKKYILAHGMACGFALVYSCVLYFAPDNGSGVAAFIMLFFFYGFLIKIIMTQNAENGGYIESLDGASGAIMYITSALSPLVFVLIHFFIAGICLLIYKRNDNDLVWKNRIIKRMIDCGEAIIASIIVKIFIPDTFVANLWINSIIIAVFTLIIPFINDWIYERFSLD
jgi:hypothetical protein